MAELESTIAQLQKLVKAHEKEIEERDAEIGNKRQAYESKSAICEALKTKNRELIVEISDLKEYIDRSKTMFEEKIVKLQTINTEYEDEIRQLKNEKSGNGVVNNVDENSANFKKLWEAEKGIYESQISKLQCIIDSSNHGKAASSGTQKNYEEEIAKLQVEIGRLTNANVELQTKVQQHVQNVRSNPFIQVGNNNSGIYPKLVDHNAADLRKYVTMADVMVKKDIDYDQLKEKILIVQCLESDPNGDYMSENWYAENIKICLKNAIFKLFLDGELRVTKELEATPLFEHLFYCNLTVLELNEQSLSYSEFMKLISSGTIKVLKFSKVYVEAKNGKKALEIDEILKNLKKLEKVEFRLTEYADSDKPSMTRGTAKKLGELERFQFLRKFEIHNLPSNFDRHAFGKFMNKHPNVQFIYSNINADEEVRLTKLEKCKRRIIDRLQ